MSNHVKVMDLSYTCENHSYNRLAIFDERDITPEKIVELLNIDPFENNDNFIVITPTQYKNIFRSMRGE